MKDTLKSVGWTILGICILVVVIFLGVKFVDVVVWLSSHTPGGDNHWVLASILVAVGVIMFVLIARTNSLWLFNRWMLWGAGLSFIIGSLVVSLVDAANHRGPGILHFGGEQPGTDGAISSPEFDAEVSETQYKREKFVMNGISLALGLAVWVGVAQKARNEAAKATAKEDYLEARIQESTAYHHAFASAIDDTSRKRAAAEAQLSAEFHGAKENTEFMWRIYSAASKDADVNTD